MMRAGKTASGRYASNDATYTEAQLTLGLRKAELTFQKPAAR